MEGVGTATKKWAFFGHLGLIAEVPEAHGGVRPPQRAENLIPRHPLTWHGGSGCLGEGGITEERDKPFIEAGLRHGSEVLAQEVGPWKPWDLMPELVPTGTAQHPETLSKYHPQVSPRLAFLRSRSSLAPSSLLVTFNPLMSLFLPYPHFPWSIGSFLNPAHWGLFPLWDPTPCPEMHWSDSQVQRSSAQQRQEQASDKGSGGLGPISGD